MVIAVDQVYPPAIMLFVAMVARNDKPPRVRAAGELNCMYWSGRIPIPILLPRRLRNIARFRPGFTIVVTRTDEHLAVAPRENQPDAPRVRRIQQIDNWRRIAHPYLRVRRLPIVLHEPHRAPCHTTVRATF